MKKRKMKKMKYRYDKKTKAIVSTPDCTEEYLDLNKIEEDEEIKENKENVHVAQVRIVVNNISPYEVYVDNKFDSSWNRLENAMAWVSKHVEVFHLEFVKGE